ncbi:MAG: thioredoxin family protein [Desulfurivibrionaceae bacterium]|nr:thioredoxin family protein [Desulfurivibrionaceae bacterium]
MGDMVITCSGCGTRNRVSAAKQHLGPKCGKCRAPLDLSGARLGAAELSDANFDSFLGSTGQVVMIDFYSLSCGHCQTMMEVVERLADRYRGRAAIAKIDSTVSMAAASRCAIRGVPAFLFFRHGREVDRITGAVPEEVLVRKLESLA